MIDLQILGTLAILPSGGENPPLQLTQPKRIALLLYLALAEPVGVQSRESLMALLWPEADVESARHSLRNALYGLRQVLGEHAIRAHGEGYVALSLDAVRCDATELRRQLSDDRWEEALAAWRGELAPGFHVTGAPEFEHWLDEQRATLRRAITRAAWYRVDELERAGDFGVVAAARLACALDPCDEVGARRLIVLLDAKAGKAAGLREYDELVQRMRREFDTEPSPETCALVAHLRARSEPRAGAVEAALTFATLPSILTATGADHPAPAAVDDPLVIAGPAARRPTRPAAALVVGVLLFAGVFLFAFRPTRSAARSRVPDPVTRAEREGALRLAARYRRDTSSYGSYLRGLTLRFRDEQIASRDTFVALVNRNPLYAPGYAGLAHAYLIAVVDGLTPTTEGYAKADAAALRAIALDSTVAAAYTALGFTEIAWRWDIRGAGSLIDRGVALDPQDPEAHILRGNWFKWQRQADSALAEYRIVYALDPLSVSHRDRVAEALLLARHAVDAENIYRQTIREYPRDFAAYAGLADVYRFTGHPREALKLLRTSSMIAGDSGELARLPQATNDSQALRILDDRERRRLQEFEAGIRGGNWISAGSFADSYAALRDTVETLSWLDSMVVHHDTELCCVALLPQYEFVRNDPRYRQWEARLSWVGKQ